MCQEETVRNGHGKTDWFKIKKGVWQSCTLSLCLFNFYAEYIMKNTRLYLVFILILGLDVSQAGIKFSWRNINNFRCRHDATQKAESEDGLKSLLMRMKKESENAGLKLNI